jgi:hypothetical protein
MPAEMKLFLLLPLAALLCACDGYVQTFRPALSASTQQSAAALDAERMRLLTAVQEVARIRGYSASTPNFESDRYTVTAAYFKSVGSGSVQVKLLQDNASGEFEFAIADWPSSKRSEESETFEADLCRKLEAP